MWTIGVTAFLVTYVNIFLRAFQQKNVMGNHYVWVLPASLGMATMEVAIVSIIVAKGFSMVPFIGLGGGLGAMCAMKFHNRYISRERDSETSIRHRDERATA